MSDWSVIITGATLFVAYANGANDNFKGVATLFGSGTTEYRNALIWATITTLAGSVAAFFLATELIAIFQGNGLVPRELSVSEPFVAAVVLSAAVTVMLATKLGMPISTTHSLTGALCGSGLVALGFDLGFKALAVNFFLPLLLSPLCAVAIASFGFPLLNRLVQRGGLNQENCLCIETLAPSMVTPEGVFYETAPGLRVIMDREAVCTQPGSPTILGINGQTLLDASHFLSAGAVSFARGLNDTPKIVALSMVAGALDLRLSTLLIAAMIALGGLFNARAVAQTVSKRITGMEPVHGLWANLVTSLLVIFASKWGMPVSTTHVSCGALFGIGIANGQARWQVIRTILMAWLLTLPLAALLSAAIFLWFRQL
jgi:inorganic phosphate transporter, PiT family